MRPSPPLPGSENAFVFALLHDALRAAPARRIGVFGAGHVGLVSAACLAAVGHDVICCDRDPARIAALARGELPLAEPGLAALVARARDERRLRFTTSGAETIAHGAVLIVAVGTPSRSDGSADLGAVFEVVHAIARRMDGDRLVVIESTVGVGTTATAGELLQRALDERGVAARARVAVRPGFLREGSAVRDFLAPERVVLGCDDEAARVALEKLFGPFAPLPAALITMDSRSAELAKYAANAMLATRVSFINEIAGLAERLGADIEQVRRGIGSDSRIGSAFLQCGLGWGGSCLPKDTAALLQAGGAVGWPMPLLAAVREVNERQRRWAERHLLARWGRDWSAQRIAVWGLGFKAGTDDVRDSAGIEFVHHALDRGATVHASDRLALRSAREQLGARPRLVFEADPLQAAHGAAALVVTTDCDVWRRVDLARLRSRLHEPFVLDGRNVFDPGRMRALGFEYRGVGRAAVHAAPRAVHEASRDAANDGRIHAGVAAARLQ